MTRLDEFRRERTALRSLEEWLRFDKKWLDTSSWPLKSTSQLATEGSQKRGPILVGGRKWSFTFWNYDVSPETRYEYFYTIRTFADPFRFPEETDSPRTAEAGYRQECPFDEISTQDIGSELCPKCGRPLVWTRYAS
jgi:hypothetical protein